MDASSWNITGEELADRLCAHLVEAEFADLQYVVLMFTPENTDRDFTRVECCLLSAAKEYGRGDRAPREALPLRPLRRAMNIREAIFAPHQRVSVEESVGRICGQPSVSCPPAIPIAVSGEVIDAQAAALFRAYGVEEISVVK